ncbi:hypothetical protein [Halovivax limisalsi]|uniref:hypothetical protein n=1 Tax=Halovivax limisalsi TaxID=1453760 RepID=UPI001FFD5906|nr:hypothetical protein [Halovivax limisalsi]
MVSRDTYVHLAATVLAIGTLAIGEYATVWDDGAIGVALAAVAYGIAFGGAHLYLAIRHEDGLIPAESRWRYVIALGVVLVAAVAIALAGDRAVGPASVEAISLGVIALTAVAYFLLEGRSGYRTSVGSAR